MADERSQLINMMLKEKEGGANLRTPQQRQKRAFHCNSL
jgi:hypothetical protein